MVLVFVMYINNIPFIFGFIKWFSFQNTKATRPLKRIALNKNSYRYLFFDGEIVKLIQSFKSKICQ